ncbi:MAG: hypothetical protein WAO83_02040 [Fuerstiella sp.]
MEHSKPPRHSPPEYAEKPTVSWPNLADDLNVYTAASTLGDAEHHFS